MSSLGLNIESAGTCLNQAPGSFILDSSVLHFHFSKLFLPFIYNQQMCIVRACSESSKTSSYLLSLKEKMYYLISSQRPKWCF